MSATVPSTSSVSAAALSPPASPTRRISPAELRSLADLFNKLASRGVGRRAKADDLAPQTPSTPPAEIRQPSLPSSDNDLDPVLRNLSSLVGLDPAEVAADLKTKFNSRGRRNTVSTELLSLGEEDKFPFGDKEKEYPFTFKLMLHKLYELKEWREKINSILEQSQNQFRSLEETQANAIPSAGRTAQRADRRDGQGARVTSPVRTPPRPSAAVAKRTGRARSSTVSGQIATKEMAPPIPFVKRFELKPKSPSPLALDDFEKVVKKRCVGRRKSTSKLAVVEGAGPSGWVYESAVAFAAGEGKNSIRRRRVSMAGPAASRACN
jgi:hypothetical protein